MALKVSPQGQVSGRSPQSSGSFRQSSGSCLRIFGLVVVSPQGQVSVIEWVKIVTVPGELLLLSVFSLTLSAYVINRRDPIVDSKSKKL